MMPIYGIYFLLLPHAASAADAAAAAVKGIKDSHRYHDCSQSINQSINQ